MTKTRARRAFDATFKIEAVCRMEERKAMRVPIVEIARDLGVRPDLPRRWAHQVNSEEVQSADARLLFDHVNAFYVKRIRAVDCT